MKPESMQLWRTSKGELLPIANMQTSHLLNSLRMLLNHFAPEELRDGQFKRYDPRTLFITPKQAFHAAREMHKELLKRELLTTQSAELMKLTLRLSLIQ